MIHTPVAALSVARRFCGAWTLTYGAYALALAVLLVSSGCMVEHEVSRTPRTAVEQALLTQSVERALTHLTVQLPEGVDVKVDATGLEEDRSVIQMTGEVIGAVRPPALDTKYIRDAVAAALGNKGYRLHAHGLEGSYLVQVMVESFGTTQGQSFFGLPPVQSVIIPFALPELTLYKRQEQTGYARFRLDMYDTRTGEFVGSSATLVGRAYYDQYTILFYITWVDTDLTAPP